ncbi:flagellar export chaperone FliS [Bacillus inaquosorum]|uniref:Flagellar secretion chaperone FliS n=1 Tax=Bacillus vallismortis TaxID=72361 RepID=A0ABY4XXN2_BACVA|nr:MULTISPECIES: flagellar export chaperone FliS [Bacillus subtilis group]MDM5303436.1 flagellar export chaperone FliS [Bacillus subtilis]MDM5325489.1 flagellar export chaperone FliS [Bacillus subtilis]USP94973.1 flagellar export chaperone FliS [Bacillus vallismortis]
MAIQNPYTAYQQNSVNTATSGELTLMLYNGCLKFIRLASQAIENDDMERKNENLIKAQNIIQELNFTLNRNIELSNSMGAMYDYMYRRLVQANIKSDTSMLAEVEGYVTDFRDAWKQAIQTERKDRHGSGGMA